jgi:hypothetical protein
MMTELQEFSRQWERDNGQGRQPERWSYRRVTGPARSWLADVGQIVLSMDVTLQRRIRSFVQDRAK